MSDTASASMLTLYQQEGKADRELGQGRLRKASMENFKLEESNTVRLRGEAAQAQPHLTCCLSTALRLSAAQGQHCASFPRL